MDQLTLSEWLGVLAGTLALVALVLAVLNQRGLARLKRLEHVLEALAPEASPKSASQLFQNIAQILDGQALQLETLQASHAAAQKASEFFVQRIGVIRYKAFDNMGADLSFSLAILDAHDCGVVITSLYGRDESRVYAKPVMHGDSTYVLTSEEREAIRQARQGRSIR